MKRLPPTNKGATFRAILIGLLLIPFNTYWITDSVGQGYPTTVSLYFNVIFCIFWLTLFNLLLLRLTPKHALSQGEILTVYVMLSLASSLAGHDMLRVLIPMIPHAFWYATPENEWAELFHRYVPDWFAVKDKEFLADFYRGESTLYTWEHVRGWIVPTLSWTGFFFALTFLMLCINVIVRKQWTEHEKLSYPIIQLPLEMTRGGGATGALRSRALWLGFGIAAAIDIINGLNFLSVSYTHLTLPTKA